MGEVIAPREDGTEKTETHSSRGWNSSLAAGSEGPALSLPIKSLS